MHRWQISSQSFATVLFLAVVFNGLFLVLPRGSFQSLVIHHSASESSDYRDIRKSHLRRGWFETAYHLVLANGSTDIPLGSLHPTLRYRFGWWSVATRSLPHNLRGLHLCIVGNFEEREVDPQLKVAIGQLVHRLQLLYDLPDRQILLHRECSPTACPGQFVDRERILAWAAAGRANSPELDDQYRQILAAGAKIRSGYRVVWLATNLVLTWLLWRTYRRSWLRRRQGPGMNRAEVR